MNVRSTGLLLGATALALTACVGGGGTSSANAQIELRTTPPVTEASAEQMAMVDIEGAGIDDEIEAFLIDTQAVIDAVATECSESPGRVQPGADFSNRTFSGPDLRCADLSNASFRDAVLDGVDLSGANLTGADFTGATLLIVGVGADFTRATFDGADLRISDLRGARFSAADLSGSEMTSLAGGLALADFSGAVLGCNVLPGSPGINLGGTTVVDDCRSLTAFNRITLGGSFYGANLAGFDFGSAFIVSTDFRRADLSSVNLADYGVFPSGSDFSGALLVGANLSGVGFYDSTFVGVDFTGANMAGVYVVTSNFSGATFAQVSMVGFGSERNQYIEAVFDDVDLTRASLALDDFTNALFGDVIATDLVIDTISCPGAVSNNRYGLCTVGTDVAF